MAQQAGATPIQREELGSCRGFIGSLFQPLEGAVLVCGHLAF